MNYTQAQIDRANAVSLEDFLRTQGETLIKSGREYRWKEHDSLTIRGNKWFRHSQSKGGYPIDFVMEFYGKSFPEAVQLLTGESGEGQTEASTTPPTAFHLPLHNRTADRAIQYLTESRGLNKTLVEAFLLSGDMLPDELTPRQTERAIRTFLWGNALFLAPGRAKRTALYTGMRLAGAYHGLHGMIVNYEPNPKCAESNLVLQRLFDEAVPQAVTLITEYLPCIRGELPWSGLYDYTFGGVRV